MAAVPERVLPTLGERLVSPKPSMTSVLLDLNTLDQSTWTFLSLLCDNKISLHHYSLLNLKHAERFLCAVFWIHGSVL